MVGISGFSPVLQVVAGESIAGLASHGLRILRKAVFLQAMACISTSGLRGVRANTTIVAFDVDVIESYDIVFGRYVRFVF
ncbi:hypothetical protein [Mitsuaria sp. 7]|uniref:hypothetical protein n=1 Tax=Mitsuaria sp. 7 TaxID=1658665 RepID=UPI0012FB5314|nr:hypothetical protein [Mitsuaria sp. 7]